MIDGQETQVSDLQREVYIEPLWSFKKHKYLEFCVFCFIDLA